jgi:hypothetical protein
MERALAAEFEAMVHQLADALDTQGLALAVRWVEAAQLARGYGPVKLARHRGRACAVAGLARPAAGPGMWRARARLHPLRNSRL